MLLNSEASHDAYRSASLSDRQANWLRGLLARHSLAAFADGREHD